MLGCVFCFLGLRSLRNQTLVLVEDLFHEDPHALDRLAMSSLPLLLLRYTAVHSQHFDKQECPELLCDSWVERWVIPPSRRCHLYWHERDTIGFLRNDTSRYPPSWILKYLFAPGQGRWSFRSLVDTMSVDYSIEGISTGPFVVAQSRTIQVSAHPKSRQPLVTAGLPK